MDMNIYNYIIMYSFIVVTTYKRVGDIFGSYSINPKNV